jgi:hypothetical protein
MHRLGSVPSRRLSDALDQLEAEGRIERRTVETATKPREEFQIRELVDLEVFEQSP